MYKKRLNRKQNKLMSNKRKANTHLLRVINTNTNILLIIGVVKIVETKKATQQREFTFMVIVAAGWNNQFQCQMQGTKLRKSEETKETRTR